jgi:aldehyde:ferredoxin oxidoreductase
MKIGEKISNLNRMVNIKNGRSRKDDTLPPRFFREKHLSGIFKGRYLSEEIFSQWLDMYYRQRGWNEQGIPTDSKLHELGLARI